MRFQMENTSQNEDVQSSECGALAAVFFYKLNLSGIN